MGIGFLKIHFQYTQILLVGCAKPHDDQVCRRNIYIAVHNAIEKLGNLLAYLHKPLVIVFGKHLVHLGLFLVKFAVLALIAARCFINMLLQKIGKLRSEFHLLVGKHRHSHGGIHNMYDNFSDADILFYDHF